jgi:fatty acid desaturase
MARVDETFHSGLERDLLDRLGPRRDGPGLLRLAAQVALGLASGALLVRAVEPWEWALGLSLQAVVHLAFFATLHECVHRTAFRTDALNGAGAWLASLCQLMPPPLMKAFHFAHHRHTHDLAGDPELAGLPMLAAWPRGLLGLGNATGLGLLVGRVVLLLGAALGHPELLWSRLLPFVQPARRAGVVWSCRLLLLLHAVLVLLALRLEPRLLRLYLAVPLGHALLAVYVTCEHRGLPHVGSVVERTRTFDPGPVVRWVMWNMPYHAEHHAYPAVPFHALPALHAVLRPTLPHVTGGILGLYARGGRS